MLNPTFYSPMPQLVRFQKGKKKFEILTKDGSVRKYRDNKLGWNHVMAADVVFTNQKKGNIASASDLKDAFGTDVIETCLKLIVANGDLQVNAQERKEDYEKNVRGVAAYLHKNYIDGSSHLPMPLTRIQAVMEESKVRFDPSASVQTQADQVIKVMQGKVVFKKSAVECVLELTHADLGKCQGIVHRYADIVRERWTQGGCHWELVLVPSNVDAFVDGIRDATTEAYNLTFGTAVTSPSASAPPPVARGKKGKSKKKKKKYNR